MMLIGIAFAVTGHGVNIRQLVRWYFIVTLYLFVLYAGAQPSVVFSL